MSLGWLHPLGPAGPQPPGRGAARGQGSQPLLVPDMRCRPRPSARCLCKLGPPSPTRVLWLPFTPKSGALTSGLPPPWASAPYLPAQQRPVPRSPGQVLRAPLRVHLGASPSPPIPGWSSRFYPKEVSQVGPGDAAEGGWHERRPITLLITNIPRTFTCS